MNPNYDNPAKNSVRDRIFQPLRNRKLNHIFTMPSSKMLCVQAMVKTGLITDKSFLYLAEKDRTIIQRDIRPKLGSRTFSDWSTMPKFRYNILEGELELKPLKDSIKDYLDFAFFDFCGMLTIKRSHWIVDAIKSCFTSGYFAITYCKNPRGVPVWSIAQIMKETGRRCKIVENVEYQSSRTPMVSTMVKVCF